MATPKLAQKKIDQIAALLAEGRTHREIARIADVSAGTVYNVSTRLNFRKTSTDQKAKNDPSPVSNGNLSRSDEITGDSWTISLPRTRIHTLDQLLEFCEVDLSVWEVERFICNKWEVGIKKGEGEDARVEVEPLFQVKATLKKKLRAVQAINDAITQFREEAAKFAPKFPPQILKMRSKYSSGVWVEHALVDHHFGALIWGKETGRDDYDMPLASRAWRDSLTANCDRTDPYKPEGILFPIGNDQQNADNRQGETENRTPQSMDSRYQKVTRKSRGETLWAIDQFLARYGRVHVVAVPGNHDPLSTFHLGDYLEAWYRNDKRVTVDTRPLFRKYWELGCVGIGFAHGDKGKPEQYGLKFAAEAPEIWGRTKWREMHTADKHHRKEFELDGVTVRILPSLRPICAWSAQNLYGAIRASESYVWSKTEGLIGSATFSVLSKVEL